MVKPGRMVALVGAINAEEIKRVTKDILSLYKEDKEGEIFLTVTSEGGHTNIGFGFYDLMLGLGIPLTTIGLGDVDSMGVIIFLAGRHRLVTPHSTMLLHELGRKFSSERRYTTREMSGMSQEDKMLDEYYRQIVCDRTGNKCDVEICDRLMNAPTVLSPLQMIELGLAHELWTPQKPE